MGFVLHWMFVLICSPQLAGDAEDVGRRQIEWLVNQNLQ